jgi:hypothetical protein
MFKIQIGNSEGYLLNDNIKQKIINYIYSNLNLSKHRYIMLNTIQKLKFLQENEHYVSPNFKGINYLLLMVTIDNNKYCVMICRKSLSYHKEQLDFKIIKVIQIKMDISDSLYYGSIFDGKLVFSNNKYIFLIQDCFYLMGKKMLEMEMEQKMLYLDSVLENNFKKNNKQHYCDNFDLKLNKLYKYVDLEYIINNLNKLQINTNGLIFYPKFSGINNIHIEKKVDKIDILSNNNENIKQTSYDIIHNLVDFLKSRTYSYEKNGTMKELNLLRTSIPDVYDIYDNKEKLGIALIPNLKISYMCNETIKNDFVKFNCIYNNKFKKWIPISPIL